MRVYSEPIPVTVRVNRDGEPIVLARSGRRERVKTVNTWIHTGAWWDGAQARTFYKLLCRETMRIVVVFREESGAWYLEQVMD